MESMALRLHWCERAAASRLTCRVLIGAREAFRQTVLIGPPRADAQGRFAAGLSDTPSSATLLAYADALARQLGTDSNVFTENY